MTSKFQTLFFFFLSFLLFSFFPSDVLAEEKVNNYAVIINQVRGESCCSAGSLESTKTQLDTISNLGLRASFAIRYDALADSRYTDLLKTYTTKFPNLIFPSGMIEIVPQLAQDAGVEYKGNETNWYHAQYAFTVGYEMTDRKKMIDTYMAKYLSIFGSYPSVTSAWMIDTESANYMHDAYAVIAHQITREQWGTDSYTLYGGPFHYPYPASQKWIFLPDYEQKNPLLVMRQTVTDPIGNYGDTSSSFTSQPNDYMRSGMDMAYFEKLVVNAFSQPNGQNGFVLLGLENSMNTLYQDEYVRQLEWLSENLAKYNAISLSASDANLLNVFDEMKISVYHGKDSDTRESWNVTTEKYRVRLLSKDGELLITDIRYYDKNIEDPYTNHIAKHEAFWVVPFVLDGSRWYKPKYGYTTGHAFLSPRNDVASEPSRITLDRSEAGTYQTSIPDRGIVVSDGSSAMVAKFSEDNFTLQGKQTFTLEVPALYPIKYDPTGDKDHGYIGLIQNDRNIIYQFDIYCTDSCTYEPISSDTSKIIKLYDKYYPYFYPEPVDRVLDMAQSKITIHNRFAIAGRNPVRVLLEPHDSMNFPILLNSEASIKPEDDRISIVTLGDLKKSQFQYIDFYSGEALSSEINISMGDAPPYFAKKIRVFFAPNCKEDVLYCLVHPIEGAWYVITKISDLWSGRR